MTCDILIVGAGVIGLSTAYHLKKQNPNLNICVTEKSSKICSGNSSKSAALYRNIFSSSTSRDLANSSIQFYKTIASKIDLRPNGYLWISKNQFLETEFNTSKFNAEILNKEEIQKIINVNCNANNDFNEVKSAILGHDCGALSAMALTKFYADEFLAMNGKILLNSEIVHLEVSNKTEAFAPWKNLKISKAITKNNDEIAFDKIIIASGCWANNLLAPIGIPAMIYPKKRQLFGISVPDSSAFFHSNKNAPNVILPTASAYIKPIIDKGLFVIGCADELGQSYGLDENPKPDDLYFEKALLPLIKHYFPKLNAFQIKMKWAGQYDYMIPDKNPVIENFQNLTISLGTSGSGIMKADALGRITAAKVLEKEKATLFDNTEFKVADLSVFNRNVDKEKFIL